jgi:hypothetical protein
VQCTRAPGGVKIPAGGKRSGPRPLLDRLTATRATFTRADVQRAAFHEAESHALARHALDHGNAAAVGKDARGETRYASAAYLRDEQRLFTTAGDLAGRQALRLCSSSSAAPVPEGAVTDATMCQICSSLCHYT